MVRTHTTSARTSRLARRTLGVLACVAAVAPLTSQVKSRAGRLSGVDRDGRIPKAKLPDGLHHPERWRYIPEGRLIQGNLFERFLISSFLTPIIFREPDIGTGGGVAITDIDFRNQRRREFANMIFTYTTEGQQAYRIRWRRWTNHMELPDGGVIQDERSFLHFNGGYNKTLTSRFFGFGPDQPESAESSYTREVSSLELFYQFTEPNPADDLVLHIGAQIEHNHLAGGRVTGVSNTRTAYGSAFDAGADHDMLWIDLRARYDTRDSLHNPYRGWYVGATANTAVLQTDGEVGALFSGYGSKVFTIPSLFHDEGDDEEENPPTDTLAFGVRTTATAGELPFYSLPSLGGSRTLRGYINNRFTDRAAWHASGEYRFWFIPRGFALTEFVRIERVGAALFYDLGSVAPTWGKLFDDKPKYSYGTSLRFSLERTALFRLDLGFSNEDTNFSIAYGLTF